MFQRPTLSDLCSAASIKGYPNKHLLTKMCKTGRAFGPMPRMIITGRILVLGELGVVFTESICFHVTSTFNQTDPIFFPRVILTTEKTFKPSVFFFFSFFQEKNLNPWSAAENSRAEADLFLVFYSENKAEIFTWIVCPADGSLLMSCLIYTGK